MLNKCAVLCTDFLCRHCSIPSCDKEIYVYGFELTFSTLFSLSVIFLVSALIGHIEYALFFVLFFVLTRFFSGGFHASTYAKCFIVTNLCFLSTIALTELVLFLKAAWLMPIIFSVSAFLIFVFSPVKNEDHPCTEATYQKNKIISRSLVVADIVAYACIFVFASSDYLKVNSGWSFTWVSIMIVIEIIKRKFKEKTEEGGKGHEGSL